MITSGNPSYGHIRGFNYQPSVGSNARDIWGDKFDAEVVRRELALGVKFFPGMNTVRLWLSHEPFLFDRERFLDHFRTTLDICDEFGFGAIPTLFNNWHSIPDFGGICPEMISYWFKAFGEEGKADHYVFRPYFETLFTTFDTHPALFAWDLCNEPFNSDSPAILPWLQNIYDSAKRLGVRTPIGVSVGASMASAERVEACSDILMIHPYFAKKNADLPELVRNYAAKGKPVLATECGWGAIDDAQHLRNVREDLDVFRALDLGFMIHAFHESPVADLHRPATYPGPISSAEYMALINLDGSLREGHDSINECCQPKSARSFDEAVQWLEEQARRTIRASLRTMECGTHAFPPQIGIGYEAFWLRDYSYMVETCAAAFTDEELSAACRLFVGAIREEDGAGVDCVKFSGEPIYKPGYGSMGSKAVADGSQFTVNVAWNTWKGTGNRDLLVEIVDALIRTMEAVPLNPQTGLVTISSAPGEDRCSYGFTDSVKKRGDVLFSSLLYIQAAHRLAEMLHAIDRPSEAQQWDAVAMKGAEAVNTTFWDEESGLYLAATERCRQPDIWGSVFAVWLNVAADRKSRRIAAYLKEHYAEICQGGQVRHLPKGLYWDEACPPDTYQNGGYWSTPTGWFVHTLALVDCDLSRKTVIDLVDCFSRYGICEWSLDETRRLPGYVASVTLPLQGIRELQGSGAKT